MKRAVVSMLLLLPLAACRGGTEAPSTAPEASAAASTANAEGSSAEAPANTSAQSGDREAPPDAVVADAPAFDAASLLQGTWTFDEERTRSGLSIELAAQLPPGLDARMTFGAPEGSGAGVFDMHWLIPGDARTEPEPGTWELIEVDPEGRRARVRASVVRTDQGGVVDVVDADILLPPDGTLHFADRDYPGLVMVWKKVSGP